MSPNWENIFINNQPDQTVYEITLNNPDQIFQTSKTLDKGSEKMYRNKNDIRLLIFKDKRTNHILYGAYLSIINEASSSNINLIKYKAYQNLTGKILYYNIDGSFANGWNYINGAVKNQISLSNEAAYINSNFDKLAQLSNDNYGNGRLQKESSDPCLTGIPDYGISCVGTDAYMQCSYYITGYTYINNCGGGGGLIGDTGGYTPTPIGQPHNGGGGGNSNNSNRDIIDSVQNPCIKAQLALAKSAKTTIRNMLNNEFGTNNFNERDIFFYDITTLPDTTAGTTHGNSAYSFIINLNKNTLPQRSKEYILSTIYHEVLHAYMDTQIGKDSSGKYLISNQHETMANNYILLMTGALKIAFPNLGDRDAWALSWGGLEETPFYTTMLSVTEQAEIQNLNERHKKATDANLRHGTYCN
ncbi:hypothetical protein GCM10008119_11450 [Pedobacter mendelii]|uniref:SprT-like family protein n=2 Tax=Pedobacter mendelii TaxID=1908240 RepID=A0ABQ2BG75_9SPHI|nr:hypothetical protein GCM10008119_11450 [Pedobacter mendelii]